MKLTYFVSFVLATELILTSGADAADPNLIGWWKLDEGTGTTVADASGAGHDGVFAEGTPEWVEGVYGGALKFDGSNKVEVPDHPDFHLQDAISVALWLEPEEGQPDYAKPFIKQKSGEYPYALQYNTNQGMYATINASARFDTSPTLANFPGQWAHMCFTYDGSALILYRDGEEVARVAATGTLQQNDLSLSIGGRLDSTQNFIGTIDDVRLFNRTLTPEEIQKIMVDAPPPVVSDPEPANGATDVVREVVVRWTPVDYANEHDVYLGSDALAVANADSSDTTGIYRGRSGPDSYTPPERLEFDQNYYWRVDEVNPDNTVSKGNLWSFTTELFAYPIDNIIATASSSEPGKEPANTVNGSGLDVTGLLHTNESVDNMWLSSRDGEQPTWIQYEFDRVHKLYEMWVWNSNDSLEQVIGLGFKEVTIEYSVDGNDFTPLGTTHEFAQAPGMSGYAHNTTIDFKGVPAKFVRLTPSSNWGGILNQYGLSEVRFLSIPISVRDPKPASGTGDTGVSVTLSWTSGREAATHNVYFSDDYEAVADGTAPMTTVDETQYGPLDLDVGTTYYWRVDEVNDAETPAAWQGDIWTFTTMDSLVADDFEGYTDDDGAGQAIWQTWIDGFGVAENGSQVGYLLPPYAEQTIVHGGLQSMPLIYDNSSASYSEATASIDSLASGRDWTRAGIQDLSLWFRGYPASMGSFVEGPAGTYTMIAGGTDIWNQADEFHFAFKQLSGTGSIVAKVESVELADVWTKAGVMIRETLEPGSKFAAVYITPTNLDGTPTEGCRFQARTDTDGSATSDTAVVTAEQTTITAPYWIKLERDVAGSFRAYYASDGVNWRAMIWRPGISMGSTVYIGLALCSHNADLTAEAKFSNVQTTGTVTGQWQSGDIGLLSNSAEPLYVAIANRTGLPAQVFHDDPAAAQIADWTQWRIPLQAFADQGIDLADVDSIAIGVGDASNAQPGGSGTVYFDDIQLYGAQSNN
ncbi:MAG: discoidin domain-containing protein [Sedimentisphaerales bacterium]